MELSMLALLFAYPATLLLGLPLALGLRASGCLVAPLLSIAGAAFGATILGALALDLKISLLGAAWGFATAFAFCVAAGIGWRQRTHAADAME